MLRIFSIFLIMSMVQINVFADIPAGKYRNNGDRQKCREGCYCQGAATNKGKWWFAGDVKKGCAERWQKIENEFSYQGMHLCPADYPESERGQDNISDCFFRNTAGTWVYYKKVNCTAGQYLPKESGECAPCPAGFYCQNAISVYPDKTKDQGITGPMPDGTTGDEGASSPSQAIPEPPVECPVGQYASDANTCKDCPAGFYCPGWDKTEQKSRKISCPDPKKSDYQMLPEEYPERYYGDDKVPEGQNAVRLYNFAYTSWHTKLKSEAECSIVLYGENQRGFFQHQGIRFNNDPAVMRYNIGGDLFYTSAKKKYYLTERYMSGTQTYCEYHKNEASKWSMLYRQALPCELNKWCPGVKETRCAAGDFNESMGLEEPLSVTCERGQYLPAYSKYCALCTGKEICDGGEFKTSHRNQGKVIAYTQQQLLYGSTGKKPETLDGDDEASLCWMNMDPIDYKECVMGANDNTPPPAQTVPSGDSGKSGDNPRDGATVK